MQEDLLGELKGSPVPALAAGMTVVDEQDNSELKRNPLEIPAPAPLTAVQKADEKHSTKAGGSGYSVKVRGDYYAPSKDQPGKKVKNKYEVDVNLPSLDNALSVIRSYLVAPAIRRNPKYADFSSVRTCEIVSVTPLSASTPDSRNLQFMSREGLEAFISDQNAPIDPKEYEDLGDLRRSVIDFQLNPRGFEDREVKRRKERKLKAELAAMNPELAAEVTQ